MDRIHELRIFVRVAETGGFTRAADDLQLPRATVSAAIKQLEARLGARLLNRTTRSVQLTQDGKAYYARCLRLLADLDEADSLFRSSSKAPRGRLRIDVPARLGRLIIAPALPDFFHRYPEIEVELGVSDRPVDLVQEGVDCVIRVGDLSDSRLVSLPLGVLPIASCASRDYLARFGTPVKPDDLATHYAVNYASPLTRRIDDWEYFIDGEYRRFPMRSLVTVNNAEAYIACCAAGLGLIQIPRYDLQGDPALSDLVEILHDWPAAPLPLSVLYPERQHLPLRVQVFADWVRRLLRERMNPQEQTAR